MTNPSKILGLNWDKENDTLELTMRRFTEEEPVTKKTILGHLGSIYDPLGVLSPTKADAVQLHLFADASNLACCAAAIAVVEQSSAMVKGLLTSKSRISKRDTSIARLELISGQMAANLAKNIHNALRGWSVKSITVWMDSMVALYWILNPGKSWKVFVANRVRKIAQITEEIKIQWRYCPTE